MQMCIGVNQNSLRLISFQVFRVFWREIVEYFACGYMCIKQPEILFISKTEQGNHCQNWEKFICVIYK